jgi:Uma2 family endonuclease
MRPREVATTTLMSLPVYSKQRNRGKAFGDGLGYIVPELTSTRDAFCPDASHYDAPMMADPMKFISEPPTFAIEVRSESDYGPAADNAYEPKRVEYFEVGTKVVWDVDPMGEWVMGYTSPADDGMEFRRGRIADAEPAVSG